MLLFVASFALYAIWQSNNRTAIQRYENEAHARGEAFTAAEVLARYGPIPDEQNAFVALEALWRDEDPTFWMAHGEGRRRPTGFPSQPSREALGTLEVLAPPSRTGQVSRAAWETAVSFVTTQAVRFDIVHHALQRPRFRAPISLEHGDADGDALPHLMALKWEVRRFVVRSWVLAGQGRAADAVSDISDISRVGTLLKDEPLLLSQLVRVATHDTTVTAVERLMCSSAPDASIFESLRTIIVGLDPLDALRVSLSGERAMTLSLFQPDAMQKAEALALRIDPNFHDGAPGQSATRAAESLLISLGWLKPDHRLCCEIYAAVIEAIRQPDFAERGLLDPVFQRLQAESNRFPPRIIAGMTVQSLQKQVPRFIRAEARRRCALVAVAVAEHRLRNPNAALPSLDELTGTVAPAAMRDPFGGDLLRIRQIPAGFMVYSIGPNLKDDGGRTERPTTQSGQSSPLDIGFHVERP